MIILVWYWQVVNVIFLNSVHQFLEKSAKEEKDCLPFIQAIIENDIGYVIGILFVEIEVLFIQKIFTWLLISNTNRHLS